MIDANKTKASLTRMNVAMARAEITVNATAGFRLPPARLVKRVGSLEDLKTGHAVPPRLEYSAMKRGPGRLRWLSAAMLGVTAFRSPIGETIQLVAIFPVQVNKLSGIEVGALFTQKSFEAPLEIGTIPRIEPITTCHNPVVAKCF